MELSETHTTYDIPVDRIELDHDFNCRGAFAPIDCQDLADDIASQGLIEPITVVEQKDGYKVIAGHRRFTACKMILKWETIPAHVREPMDEVDARLLNLSENVSRKQLNILQEANAIKHIAGILTLKQIATKLGVSVGWVQIRVSLLKLPPSFQDEAAAGVLTQADIIALYEMRNRPIKEVATIVKTIKEKKQSGEKRVSVKQLMKTISDRKKKRELRRIRNLDEVHLMQDTLREACGNGLETKLLAWVCGHISSMDLMTVLKDYAREDWQVPEEYR